MDSIVSIITNNGVAVVVVAYFLFRDMKFHDTLISSLTAIQINLEKLNGVKNNEDQ